MERSVAIKKLGKLLGKSLGYRVDDKAPTRERREAAKVQRAAAITVRDNLREQRDARYKAILAADSEYQSLRAAHALVYDEVQSLSGEMMHYKITVGTSTSMFFHVKAQGDSWEDVIDKLTTKAVAGETVA